MCFEVEELKYCPKAFCSSKSGIKFIKHIKEFLIYRKYKLSQSCMYSSRDKTMWIKTRTFVFRHVISAGVPPCRLAVRRLKVHKPESTFFFHSFSSHHHKIITKNQTKILKSSFLISYRFAEINQIFNSKFWFWVGYLKTDCFLKAISHSSMTLRR